MAFKAGEIVFQITAETKALNKAMGDVSANVQKNFGNIAKTVGNTMMGVGAAVTGAVAGIGYKALSAAEEVSKASTKIVAALGLPKEEAERFRQMIREVYGDNFGESLTDVGVAIQEIAVGLAKVGVMSNEEIVKATENAYMLRDAYQVDIGESVGAVTGLMQNFGLTSQQAFDFLTLGMQRGMNTSGDFLESIGEYSTQFAEGGATAAQFFSMMETGMQSGMLGTDKAADAFKEFRVRLLDGSKATAGAMAMIGLDIGQITAQINAGTLTTADAWDLVIEKLRGTKDQAVQLQAGVGLIGSQFEDLGAKTVLAMTMGMTSMDEMKESTANLSEQYKTLGNDLEGVKRKMVLASEAMGHAIAPALGRILDAVAPVIEKFAAWVEKNPELAATLGVVAGALGALILAAGIVIKIAAAVAESWILVKAAFAIVATAASGLAAAIGLPVWAVVAIVAAATAAIYYYWDELKYGLGVVWRAISSAWMTIWGPIIDGIMWLQNIGLSVLEKAQGLIGWGGGGGGGPQYAMAGPGGGGPQYAMAGPGGGGGGGGFGGGISLTFNVSGITDPGAFSRMAAEQLQLELRSRGL